MIARRIGALMNGTKAKLGLLAALLSIAGAGEARALDPDHVRALPESDGPLQVQIGFHVFNIVVDKFNRAGRKADGDRLDRICRWVFPLGYVLVTALIALVFSLVG